MRVDDLNHQELDVLDMIWPYDAITRVEVLEERPVAPDGTSWRASNKDAEKVGSQLQKWGARLDELMAKAAVAGKNAKSDAREAIEALKVKHAAARAKLKKLEARGQRQLGYLQGRLQQFSWCCGCSAW